MNEQVIEFLTESRSHNSREWLQDNKSRYGALRKAFIDEVQDLIGRISLFDPEAARLEVKDCLFRIYGGTRFPPDETPYKCHFVAYISQDGHTSERDDYYIHPEPRGYLLSGSVWCPPPALLKKSHQDIYDHTEGFTAIIEGPTFREISPVLEGEMLKCVPVSYPMDSLYGYIVRHKDFSMMPYKPDNPFHATDQMDEAVDDFKLLLLFDRFLNYTVGEYLGRV